MELVNRYESRRDGSGHRQVLADDIKMSILESMCPSEIERHLQLNRSKFVDFNDMHAELSTYLETRVGVRLKIESLGSSKRGEDDMDIGAFGKGKEKAVNSVVKEKENQMVEKVKASSKVKVRIKESLEESMVVRTRASLAQIRRPRFVSTVESLAIIRKIVDYHHSQVKVRTTKEIAKVKEKVRMLTV